MTLIHRLKKAEDHLEQAIEAFCMLVGASETPEEWASCEQPHPAASHQPGQQEPEGRGERPSLH
jgi:hypothetical protein